MGKIKIEGKDKSRYRIIYNVRPEAFSESSKDEIIEQFCSKYKVEKSQVEVLIKYIDETENSTSCIDTSKINSIQQPEFQRSLIFKYLELNGVKDYNKDKIIQIDSLVNNRINFSKYEERKTYRINSIKFDNFLSYGDDNMIDFRDFRGLVLLRGNPANQSGKTTLCNDLIHFALFGETKSGKAPTLGQIFNKFRPEKNEVKVETSLTIENIEYIIRRTLKRAEKRKSDDSKVKNSVEYFRVLSNGSLENIEEYSDVDNLKGESTTQTNKVIKDTIGNPSDFDLMSSINASNLSEIIYLKDSERSRAMIRWFGLQSIQDKDVLSREIWNKEISKVRYSHLYNREQLQGQNENIENGIDEDKKKISENSEKIKEIDNKIESFNRELDALISSIRTIDKNLEKIDYNTLLMEMEKAKEDGIIASSKIEDLKLKLKEFPEVEYSEDEYMEYDRRVKQLISDISGIKIQISNLKNQNKVLLDGEYCPTCKRKLDNVDNSEAIAQNEQKIRELIELGKADNAEKIEKEKALENMAEARKLNREKNNLELRIAKNEVELNNKRTDYKNKLRVKKDIEINRESIENNNKTQNKINIVKANINTEQTYKQNLYNEITSLTAEINSKIEKVSQNKKIIEIINKEMDDEKHWKLYHAAIGKDGITKMILRESIPLLNSQIKSLLQSSDINFDVTIEINEKNDIQFFITKGDISAPLTSGSGYEQLVSALVLRTVISQFSMIPKPPFIILDEVLGSVSNENLPKVKKLFENISNLYDFVFHITHLEDVVDWHNKIITVTKENNVSSLKQE